MPIPGESGVLAAVTAMSGWQSYRPSRQDNTQKIRRAGRRALLLTLGSGARTNSSQTSALMIITTDSALQT
jgi:hypothetical protein